MTRIYRFQPTDDLNFGALATALAAERSKPVDEARDDLQSVLEIIGRTVAAGHRVRLTNFGTFERGTHRIAKGALGGRVQRAVTVKTIKFHGTGKFLDAVRTGRKIGSLRKDPKTPRSAPAE
jgi:nucleoid DNA-binding protein